MFKSGLLLSVGNTTAALLGLVRNVLIARLLSVDDFGIASTFAITMALVEMTSNIALDRLMVQSKDGDNPVLQSTLQTIQVGRGILGALILFLIAHPLAMLFGIPDVAWAYQVLAIVPFLRGLAHLDMFRFQREMRFKPVVLVELSSQGISTLTAVPLALWLDDYRAMLFAILAQQLVFLIVSHIVAERPYKLHWNRDKARSALGFGWPLLINNLLLFGIFQGDRIIIGNGIGITELGWFAAAFTITFVPALVISKTIQGFFLPILSKSPACSDEFRNIYIITNQAALLAGVTLAALIATIVPPLFLLLFGSKFEPALSMFIWLAIAQGVRIARTGPTIASISMAKTMIPLVANIVRVSILPIAWLIVQRTEDINNVLQLAATGEILALIATYFILRTKEEVTLNGLKKPIAVGLIAFIWIATSQQFFPPTSIYPGTEQVFLIGVILVLIWSMHDLRCWIKSFL